jgi:hypothetical protein
MGGIERGTSFSKINNGGREGITSSPRKNKGGPPIKIAVTTFQARLSSPGCKKSAPLYRELHALVLSRNSRAVLFK